MSRPAFTAVELSERFGLALHGDGNTVVNRVATLSGAGKDSVSFLSNRRYREQLQNSQAGVVVLREADAQGYEGTALVAADPYVSFALIAALFDPPAPIQPGIHTSAIVDASAMVDASAEIGPMVIIGARSRVEPGARLGPACVVGEDCVVGEGSELIARVTLVQRVRLGKRVRVHPGAVLGADGFGLAMAHPEHGEAHWIKVPQQGGVVIGDDCEIGANTTIDRGAIEDTVLEHDVRLDNQIQVGHNVRIGAHTAMAGCAAVAGSAEIGRYCLIGGGAGILGHLRICDHVTVNAMALVTSSIQQPGEYSSGTPLMPTRDWRKSAARFKQLDSLTRKLAAGSQEE